MAKLIYSAIASLDGYVADEDGRFDWAAPSDEVHAFVNDLERPIGTYLYGRRMYETMVFWETFDAGPDQALAAGLVDECHLFLTPIIVGGGTAALPEGVRVALELLGERRFGNGVVQLHYRVV